VMLEKDEDDDLEKCVKNKKKIETVKEEGNKICFFILCVE